MTVFERWGYWWELLRAGMGRRRVFVLKVVEEDIENQLLGFSKSWPPTVAIMEGTSEDWMCESVRLVAMLSLTVCNFIAWEYVRLLLPV